MNTTDAGIVLPSLDPTLTLLVARRSSKRVVGGQVAVADDARGALVESVRHAHATHATLAPRLYDPDAHLEDGEYFHVARADVEDSMGVLELLDGTPETDPLDVSQISRRPQLFYAVVTGANPDARVAYVTRSNPARVAGSGYFFTPKGQVLTRVETPVLLFEDRVDLIVTAGEIVINDQDTFEQWFRDTPVIQERVGDWVTSITNHLPLDADGAARLEAQARAHPRLRRLLYVIHQRGHLMGMEVTKVRAHIESQGLDVDLLVKDGKLVFDDKNPMTLLKLLNEDLFRGGLTDEPFVVDRKAKRA